MAQSPSSSSTQPTVAVKLATVQAAGTIVRIQTTSGEEVATFAPSKNYQSVVLSTPKLVTGTAYEVIIGGSSTGTRNGGLYEGGTFTGGTKVATVTATTTNTSTGGMGPPGGDRTRIHRAVTRWTSVYPSRAVAKRWMFLDERAST